MSSHLSSPSASAPPLPVGSRRTVWLSGLAIAVVALVAYANSFSGAFVFDDLPTIIRNESLRNLSEVGKVLSPPLDSTVSGRPVANLTFAINYAIGGLNPRGYHAGNLLIHILAGLTLFGVVRRTLLLAALRAHFETVATSLALAAAILWAVHPLQTESVTYIVQRVESLLGLFYLLTLYCFIRAAESASPGRWHGLAVAACLLGMGTKEVMVSAPLLVLLYDRTLVAGSFRSAWQQRRGLYSGLFSTWLLLAWLVLSADNRAGTAGFGTASSWEYLLTQCQAIVHYLRLSVIPHPLVFDYGKGLISDPLAVAPQALLLVALLAATVRAAWRRSAWALLGVWFFAILAPSSSVVPVATQTMAEHRMYLPLAAVIVALVMGGYVWLGRRSLVAWAGIAAIWTGMTLWRNQDYHSELRLWTVTTARQPNNPRAVSTLGQTLFNAGRTAEAIARYEEALRLQPDHFEAHNNLGIALLDAGRVAEAQPHFAAAARLQPEYAQVHSNLGMALHTLGRTDEALPHCEKAVKLEPNYAEARSNLGIVLNALGRPEEAARQCEAALKLKPLYAEAHSNLGMALEALGRPAEAIARFEEALRLKPGFRGAQSNLAKALVAQGRLDEAIPRYEEALRLAPDSAVDQYGLGNVLVKLRRWRDALAPCEAAVRLQPDHVESHTNLGTVWFFTGQPEKAVHHFETALRLKPDSVKAHYFLGNVLASVGQPAKAKSHYEEALRLNPNYGPARENLVRLRQSDSVTR